MTASTQHIETARANAKKPAYIAGNGRLYTAFVTGKGFRANVSLRDALAFVREQTGQTSGAVPYFDETEKEWGSEFDIGVNA